MTAPPLTTATPAEWWATHLDAWFRRHEDEPFDESTRQWVTGDELLADDGAHLRQFHARMMSEDGAPAAAAAKWVTGSFPGALVRTVGFVHAVGHAALVFPPDGLRFGLHPDGWAERVDVSAAQVVVAADHPWAGLEGVRVVADDAAVAVAAVTSLEAACGPLLDAARRLGKVGRSALWAEMADEFGLGLLHQLDVPGDPAIAERVQRALRTPGAPWRKRPSLRVVPFEDRPVFVGRKGGCCLAYQCEEREEPEAEVDRRHQAYLDRFGTEPRAVSYCTTCSLRDEAGCTARQLFWHEQERAERSV